MPDLRTLPVVLAELAFVKPGLVLYQEGDYWRIEQISARARREAASGPRETREFLSRPEFWVDQDSRGKVLLMRESGTGSITYATEPGSERAPETRAMLGRKNDCVGTVFERRCYEYGSSYPFEQLPAETRRDAKRQTEELEYVFGKPADELIYRFDVLRHSDLVRMLEHEYGARFPERLESPAVRRMATSIEREGLKYPPVVDEGWKRALALAALGMDMPYFSVVPPVGGDFPVRIPSLEGRRRPQ